MADQSTSDANEERKRLVDHFKRVYSIIVGLAITEACKKLFPFSPASFGDYQIWMFAALFVSIVPIFHGGDRSLDRKYIAQPAVTPKERAFYIWDVYMLLITAILFVGIAEVIPDSKTPSNPAYFYYSMWILFWFDAFVLILDFLKSDKVRKQKLKQSYKAWIPMNLLVGMVCLAVAIYGWSPLVSVSFFIFILALARTILDYSLSDDFMFP